jgi:hypothetical protein
MVEEKVLKKIYTIHKCKISTIYDKNNKQVLISKTSNKIRYGGRYLSIEDCLLRFLQMYIEIDKIMIIEIQNNLYDMYKNLYDMYKNLYDKLLLQDTSIAGNSLEL